MVDRSIIFSVKVFFHMKHPFEILKPEYSQLLSVMTVRPECRQELDRTAAKLLAFKTRYAQVSDANGVPIVFIASSFEREAGSDFTKNPAQGWPLTSVSKEIPRNGPFRSWFDAAIVAYRLNGLDKVGAGNWTWELACFYGEMFNGFGYRDVHHMHTPYLWGGTNIQTAGKYDSDGKFNASHMDQQLGIIPVAKRMIEISPDLAFSMQASVSMVPIESGLTQPESGNDALWLQHALNQVGFELMEDGSYGRQTKSAVEMFQRSYGLAVDGLAGPETIAALKLAVEAVQPEKAPVT
jgi:lysozyme family protein